MLLSQEPTGSLQHQGGQHMNQWQEANTENSTELPSQTSTISNQTVPMANTVHTDMDMMANANVNQVITRNEPERIPEQKPPQVRKISRFQVSHVKEEDKSVKLPNLIHGADVLLENVSPEKQVQVSHDLVTHNIQSPVDTSPDKIESMVGFQDLSSFTLFFSIFIKNTIFLKQINSSSINNSSNHSSSNNSKCHLTIK